MTNNQNLKPFKPGNNANPTGRPKGSKNFATIIKKILQTKVTLKEHPLTRKPGVKLSVQEMMALAMIKEALRIKTLTDRNNSF